MSFSLQRAVLTAIDCSSHVDAILENPQLCAALEGFHAEVFRPSFASFERFVTALPNLRVFKVYSDACITGEGLVTLFERCPHLEQVAICGNDKVRGRLNDKALAAFAKRTELTARLRELILYDQPAYDAEKLSKKIKNVRISAGETEGDGYAAQVRLTPCFALDRAWYTDPLLS
jgi:hypothetical protein